MASGAVEGRLSMVQNTHTRRAAGTPQVAPVPEDDILDPMSAALALRPPSAAVQNPTLEALLDLVRAYSEPTDEDLEAVERAYRFAERAHEGQERESGEPYVKHVLAVAMILAEMRLVDPETLQAALLHDTIEDCPQITRATLVAEFGEPVAKLVDGVTKLSDLPKKARLDDPEARATAKRQQQAETLRKMFIAMFDDMRVVLIKLADRLHNMRTLEVTSPEKQRRIARQTLDIYAPLANRLGIWQFKSELEDLSFYYLEPERYAELVAQIQDRKESSSRYIQKVTQGLERALRDAGIECEIKGRTKHIYSMYQKMLRKNRSWDRIYDLLAVRVIVGEIQDCYATLGVIHSLWPPIVGEFDDYIAVPKESMYQSLHTAVWAFDNKPLEIQIRTHKMHETAEFGIAAHWRYKEGQRTARRDREYEAKIASLRRQMDWRHDDMDAQEFVDSLQSDLFQDHIYVYTPSGDIVDLPSGATPIDFAFRIHTELGYQCGGATVNGKMVNLDHPLNNGDQVKIIKDTRRKGPSRDWIQSGRRYVTTAAARQKISQWFRRQAHDENVAQGREILALFPRYDTFDRLLEAIGNTDIGPAAIVAKLTPLRAVAPTTRVPVPTSTGLPSLELSGNGLLHTIARCCRPMPGDEIMGYTTRGRGITVHRDDCYNLVHLDPGERERLVRVTWDGMKGQRYLARVRIEALDRVGLLHDVTKILSEERVNMNDINSGCGKGSGTQVITANMEVTGVDQFLRLMSRLEGINGVYEVHRVVPSDKVN
jgi:GTP pyrophosphokinase